MDHLIWEEYATSTTRSPQSFDQCRSMVPHLLTDTQINPGIQGLEMTSLEKGISWAQGKEHDHCRTKMGDCCGFEQRVSIIGIFCAFTFLGLGYRYWLGADASMTCQHEGTLALKVHWMLRQRYVRYSAVCGPDYRIVYWAPAHQFPSHLRLKARQEEPLALTKFYAFQTTLFPNASQLARSGVEICNLYMNAAHTILNYSLRMSSH